MGRDFLLGLSTVQVVTRNDSIGRLSKGSSPLLFDDTVGSSTKISTPCHELIHGFPQVRTIPDRSQCRASIHSSQPAKKITPPTSKSHRGVLPATFLQLILSLTYGGLWQLREPCVFLPIYGKRERLGWQN